MAMSMLGALWEPFATFGFMRRALVASVALGMGAGPVGVMLQLRRMSLIGDAMSHAILPGAKLPVTCCQTGLPVRTTPASSSRIVPFGTVATRPTQ